MSAAIAIVGMACRYADASSPQELWETVLSQRRAFRRIPPERLRLEDYLADDALAADSTYLTQAAVLDGWQFDRVRFRVAGSTFRAADLAHWLALEVASQALKDAGLSDLATLPRDRTGVLLGNTLTGEFSRANTLRLRWPYVRRVFASTLAAHGVSERQSDELLSAAEAAFKAPLAAMDEDALAGGLSNTIAGRICASLDLGGGGYTVDAACAASLLAVINACTALSTGDLDFVIAGGVDLSLDPFELVGFAKAGAFARTEMRVYDQLSEGFWPGEGCGFVALERLDDARARGHRVHATIRGWGVSSDGAGSIIRPRLGGQLLALRQAYARAGFGIESIDLFEGHGTGTAVGDDVELSTLTTALSESGARTPAAIGSIKANIGHTKAAAGVAGLIKATLSVRERVLPPTTGCKLPHRALSGPGALLRPLATAEPWSHDGPGRAAVSAMGFGGINTHVVLEGEPGARRLSRAARRLGASPQDAELFLLAARDREGLGNRVAALQAGAGGLSLAEMGDLAATLQRELPPQPTVRAAVVAGTPAELAEGLARVADALSSRAQVTDVDHGIAVSSSPRAPRVGLLFPGQGSPVHADGGALGRRFPELAVSWPAAAAGSLDTAVAQPAIVVSALQGLDLLAELGLEASAAVGHSLGELVALHWAGACGREELVAIAEARGAAMGSLDSTEGAMASIAAGADTVAATLEPYPDLGVAGYNGPSQTVVSGPSASVDALVRSARERALAATKLPVSHAFHSALVAPAAAELEAALDGVAWSALVRPVISTVTGAPLAPDHDLRELLLTQITAPVRFQQALEHLAERVDVLLEAGPGHVLRDLARAQTQLPVMSLEAAGDSLRPALIAAGTLWTLGCPLRVEYLFAGRFTRPFSLGAPRGFLASPCESAPVEARTRPTQQSHAGAHSRAPSASAVPARASRSDTLAVLRALLARRTELPEEAITPDSQLLRDLNLTSIAVSEITAATAAELGLQPLAPTTELANATVRELAAALDAATAAGGRTEPALPDGVAAWQRPLVVELTEMPPLRATADRWQWRVLAPGAHPLGTAIVDAFGARSGQADAVLVCLPPDRAFEDAAWLLRAGQRIVSEGIRRCAFLQHGGGAAGFAKSLKLEHPEIAVTIIDLPPDPQLLAAARREAESTEDFLEVILTSDGRRLGPVLRPAFPTAGAAPLRDGDVVVFSGGGQGIGAECALELARTTGASIALLGRSRPDDVPELAENLRRFARAGARTIYVQTDVADAAWTRRAIERVTEELGPVRGLVHCAGRNEPARIEQLDDASMAATLAPKIGGLRNLLAAIDRDGLRMLVTFGSIIGRTGLRGEAHYALANDWLALEVARLSAELPRARCLNIEWSVWSGAGMGERLGTITALAQQGVSPIPVERGVELMNQLLGDDGLPPSVIASGRFGTPPTVALEPSQPPLLRFLERVPVHYPGIELVAECDLSHGTDPYLTDHVVDGVTLLPVVFALEGMASAARALTGRTTPLEFQDVVCSHPITVGASASRTVRIAALAHEDGVVELAVRSDETGFQVDHVHATCRFSDAMRIDVGGPPGRDAEPLELVAERDLYGTILFHGPRFQRVAAYRELQARSCIADVLVDPRAKWFGDFMPQELALGDPAARDATIHAIQACIPHRRLVPVAIERLRLAVPSPAAGPLTVHARERSSDGDSFIYDVNVTDSDGRPYECWEGLTLRSIGSIASPTTWPAALLAPYLQRRASELLARSDLALALSERPGTPRRAASQHAITAALGASARPLYRPDGRPEIAGHADASVSHLGDCTLAVIGAGRVAADLEVAAGRSAATWAALLADERHSLARLLAAESGQELDIEATRVWTAVECLKKAGAPLNEPLKLSRREPDGWTLLRAGDSAVATLVTQLRSYDQPVALALAVGPPARAATTV